MNGRVFFYTGPIYAFVQTTLWWSMIRRILLIFTARKRSLGQGNKFTGVCLSTRGVPGPVWCLVLGEGVPGAGGAWSKGGLLPGGVWRPPPDGCCCGRCASYWNAFLSEEFFLRATRMIIRSSPTGGNTSLLLQNPLMSALPFRQLCIKCEKLEWHRLRKRMVRIGK